MKTVAIVCNGQFPRKEFPLYLLRSADFVVCCDGALTALEKRGIVPDVVIGDLDSVCGRALKRFPGRVVQVSDQDTNDLTKAFDFVMKEIPDCDRIHILAATGYREDHTLGNLSLLMEYERRYALTERGISVDLVSDYSTCLAIGDSTTLDVGEGRLVSVFTPDPSLKIHSEGLHWPTDEVVFDNWWKASLNRAATDRITLTLSHPAPVLVILG
jgi:thiamine pyrophosphokinase